MPVPVVNDLWNLLTTGALGMIAWMFKGKASELDKVQELANRTREELARDYVTRAEYRNDYQKLLERMDAGFERLSDKIDEIRK